MTKFAEGTSVPVEKSRAEIEKSPSGRPTSHDLLVILEASAGDANNAPDVCWLYPDDIGLSYCYECAEEQINYFGRGTFVECHSWGSYEADCCIHCETCGRMLNYSLTPAGIEYELDHFKGVRFRKPLTPDDAAHIARMLAAAPDDEQVIAVARRALRAAGIDPGEENP